MTFAMGTTLGRYEIRSQLGAGGMGEVYLAEDTQLGRRVAIKLLSPELVADERANKRLVKEARAAATLDHPNICSIYEVGKADGRGFIAMQYIEGETLEARIKRKPLELKESLAIAAQIADALAEAHSHRIIHRDIKPGNIMITVRGQAKVMDFGLAKVIGGAVESKPEAQSLFTTPGAILGTVPYMSPEQVRGRVLDARTDIFSFGVLLYEMVSGKHPFASESAAATASAILTRAPMSLLCYAEEVPLELEWTVKKALRKDREERYQSMKELLNDLRAIEQASEFAAALERNAPTTAEGTSGSNAKPALSAERVTAGIRRHRRTIFAAACFVISIAVVFYVYAASNSKAAIDSLAVLPFVNASGDPEMEYLSDGITDSLINSLSRLPNLKVMSRNSVFHYKDKGTNAQAAGQALGVRAVLTGRLLQRGDKLSISIALVDARDNSHILGQQYNSRVSDILGMQREIARDISERLRLRLVGKDEKRLTKRYTENADAYQLYLKGRFYWNKRRGEAYRKAIELFNEALEKDPNYALAYSGLADCYSLGDYPLPPKEKYPLARQAALKALELDDTLAEPHAALGRIKQEFDWDREGAEGEFKRSIELNPDSSLAHMRYAGFLTLIGKHDEAIVESKQAVNLDPLSALMNWALAYCYYFARRYDEAIEQDLKTLEIEPDYGRSIYQIGASYEQKGGWEKAFEWYAKSAALEGGAAEILALKQAYSTAGGRGYYRKQLDLEMAKTEPDEYEVATLYARLDDKERAVEWLQKCIERRSGELVYLRISPAFDNMRSDPRVMAMMKRVGLAP